MTNLYLSYIDAWAAVAGGQLRGDVVQRRGVDAAELAFYIVTECKTARLGHNRIARPSNDVG